MIRWGILGTGSIAGAFARGVALSTTGELVAVGSRARESAEAFCLEHGGRAYASYDSLLADPEVDVVYISLPHHMHHEWTIRCAEVGKGVLCEKPFTLNSLEAEEAIAACRKADVFFMEAFMYRCSPQMKLVRKLLAEGAIGEVLQVNAEFGYATSRAGKHFRVDADLGGGGLMDVGCYCVSLSRMCFGEEPLACHYSAQIRDGYDASAQGLLTFSGGRSAVLGNGVHCALTNDVRIYGSGGMIQLNDPWKSENATVTVNGEAHDVSVTNAELYMHQADAVAEFFGAKECPYVSIEDTLAQMRTLDRLRASAGITFAQEKRPG